MVCFCPTSVSRSPRPSLRSAFSNFLNILTRAWSGIMCSRFSLEMSKTGCFVCVSGIFRRKLTKEVYLGERRHCLTKVKCFLTRLILQWWSWWMNHSEWYRSPAAMIYKPVFFQIYNKDLNRCHLILWLLLAKRLRWTIGTLWEFIGQLWLFEDDGAKWGGDVNDKWGEIALGEGICERLDGEVWWGGVRWGGDASQWVVVRE